MVPLFASTSFPLPLLPILLVQHIQFVFTMNIQHLVSTIIASVAIRPCRSQDALQQGKGDKPECELGWCPCGQCDDVTSACECPELQCSDPENFHYDPRNGECYDVRENINANASPFFVLSSGAVLSFSGVVTALFILSLVFNIWMYCAWRRSKAKRYAVAKMVDSDSEMEVDEVKLIGP